MASPRRAKSPDALTLGDFSDRELLAIVGDIAQANGGIGMPVSTNDVAERCFGKSEVEGEEAYYRRCVGSRFSWMSRFGMLEKSTEEKGLWYLTAEGNELRRARLSSSLTRSIDSMRDEATLTFAAAVGERLLHAGTIAGKAMERELRWSIERRKRLQTGR